MTPTIERRLGQWSTAADAGWASAEIVADPEYDIAVRAFRLKHFGRCPCCDTKAMRRMDDIVRLGTWLRCSACGWAVFCWYLRDLDPDGLLLAIARGTSRYES